jgi:hypothetical protein
MPKRRLQCAIEELVEWFPHFFLDTHIASCVAVLSQYTPSPAIFDVDCENIASQWLGIAISFTLSFSWSTNTAAKAGRLRATMQSKQLVELAAVAIGLVLSHRVLGLGQLDIIEHGDRADYRSVSLCRVLEISGTETVAGMGRRHHQKGEASPGKPVRMGRHCCRPCIFRNGTSHSYI